MRPVPGIRSSSTERGRRPTKRVVSLVASAAILLLGVAPASAVEAMFTPTGVSVSEDGTTATYQVSLANELPTDSVIVTIASPDGQVTTEPEVLVFTPQDHDQPQDVVVTAVDDDIAEGPHTPMITHVGSSADPDYDGDLGAVAATIADNDAAGVTIVESDGSSDVIEGGPDDSYTIALDSEPIEEVMISISETSEDLSVDPEQLSFSPSGWDTPQTVTISVANDDVAGGAEDIEITHEAISDDPNYSGIQIDGVSVAVTDDDIAGLARTPAELALEEGDDGEYTLRLTSRPSAEVTVALTATPVDLLDVSVTEVTFTPENYADEQAITISTFEDDVVEPSPETVTIAHNGTSEDPDYNGALGDVTVDISDDDTAGVSIDRTSIDVYEGGPSDTYHVVLTSEPDADVTIGLDADVQSEADPAQLVFTQANWSTPQAVTVSAADDTDVEASPHDGLITHTASSGDESYEGVAIHGVALVITDDDGPISFVETDGSTFVNEEGTTSDTYGVVLDQQPTSFVTVQILPDEQATVDPEELTFTPTDWDEPQTVTVTAFDDARDEGELHSGAIVHRASVDPPSPAGDPSFDGPTAVLTMSVQDNDDAAFIVEPRRVSVSEDGQTDSYSVSLATDPAADVTVSISTDGDVSVSPAQLMFTAGNFGPQPVEVSAVDDDDREGSHIGVVTNDTSSSDPLYDGGRIQVIADIEDNDIPGVILVESEGQTAVTEGGDPDEYTLSLASRPAADVTITITGDPQLGVDPTTVTFTETNFTGLTVEVTAEDDRVVNGTRQAAIDHTASSSDPDYDNIDVDSIDATVFDDDVASILIQPTGSTTEVGEGVETETDTYEVRLTAEPSAPVTVDITGTAQVDVSPASLTFDATDFSMFQAVTVTAVDDTEIEGTHSSTISHSVSSEDPAYDGPTAVFDPSSDVGVTILDNDLDPTIAVPSDEACVATADVTFEGTAGRFQPITVQNTAPAATTTAAADGSWTATGTFDDGEHTVTATDGDGRASDPVTFTVLSAPPTAPVISDPADDDVVGAEVTVTGTADEDQMITLFRAPPEPASGEDPADPEELGTATADENGDWSIDVTFTTSGEVTLFARTADCAGNTSDSDEVTFTVDIDGPEVTVAADFLQIAPGSDATASGTAADPNGVASISVVFNDFLTGSTTEGTVDCPACPGNEVTWSAAAPLGLGIYEVVVTATDATGNVTTASAMFIKL